MSRLTRDGTAEPVSRDQILRRVRGQGNINFTFSAEHELLYVMTIHNTYICTPNTCSQFIMTVPDRKQSWMH